MYDNIIKASILSFEETENVSIELIEEPFMGVSGSFLMRLEQLNDGDNIVPSLVESANNYFDKAWFKSDEIIEYSKDLTEDIPTPDASEKVWGFWFDLSCEAFLTQLSGFGKTLIILEGLDEDYAPILKNKSYQKHDMKLIFKFDSDEDTMLLDMRTDTYPSIAYDLKMWLMDAYGYEIDTIGEQYIEDLILSNLPYDFDESIIMDDVNNFKISSENVENIVNKCYWDGF